MKVLAVTSHSKNNESLYNLTIKNHIDYFNKYGISYLTLIDDYNKFIDVQFFKNLLLNYELVFTVGSDVLFTDFNRNIFDFLDLNKDINVCEEGLGVSITNGEIVFYKRGCEKFLDVVDILQKENPLVTFGTQSILNSFFEQAPDYADEHINLIEKGKLQSYLLNPIDLAVRKKNIGNEINKVIWKHNKSFILHAIGGSNQEKYERISEKMERFNL